MGVTRPSLDYLATCSEMSLESVELSRLNLAANLRKHFEEILEEWIDTEVDARLARAVLEWRRVQDSGAKPLNWRSEAPKHCEQLAMAFLPDAALVTAHVVGQGGSIASAEDIGSGYVATVWQTQSASQIGKADHQQPLPLSRALLPQATGEHHEPARESSNSPRSRSCRSTSLAKAAAVRDMFENLVERRCSASFADPKNAERKTASSQSARKADSVARPLGVLAAVAPPMREDSCQMIRFVPKNVTRKIARPPAHVEGCVPTPSMRYGIRSG
jgi:hypothetical protein